MESGEWRSFGANKFFMFALGGWCKLMERWDSIEETPTPFGLVIKILFFALEAA